ncbi:hypothetical protein N802_08700 [Knoellia sinensis KCTC 19936]|uniref:Orc1-like AAA ATPase domain-containing protein n=1 Tax=Knoellia sinensis KCTC 19936 TaxID=1385520 RepID=A0A0A0JEF3_9MICO|nr:ATP-binding protein [Knoellia sinensis]KGN33976.1 hypothetical protein N802_08700 [Knoellia sinensis KCTC 19936]
MRPTVADRLRAGGSRVIGRDDEIRLAREFLRADGTASALHVHGPGGVGKTCFLREVERVAYEADRPTVWLDCADLDGGQDGLLDALGTDDPTTLRDTLPTGSVVFIDRFEVVRTLEPWFWSDVVPSLPTDTRVIIASRHRPREIDVRLRVAGVVDVLPLRNLDRMAAADLLHSRGVPGFVDVEPIVTSTYGHPLALVIAADAYVSALHDGDGTPTPPDADPSGTIPELTLPTGDAADVHLDPAGQLLRAFVDDVEDPLHRHALNAAAHARRVDRSLLRRVLQVDSVTADDVLQWLRDRPYAELHPDGLALHDIVRDALDFDLRWRDPEAYRSLHAALRKAIGSRFQHGDDVMRQRAATDLVYLSRPHPAARLAMDFSSLGHSSMRPVRPDEHDAVLAMVTAVEGPARAAGRRAWLAAQPGSHFAIDDDEGTLIGCAALIRLDLASESERQADPVTAAAWSTIKALRPPEPGERVLYEIAVSADRSHQGTVIDVMSIESLKEWSTPGLGWVVTATTRIDEWSTVLAFVGMSEIATQPLADGRTASIWARDFGRSPFAVWSAEMAIRETDESGAVGPFAAPIAWSRSDFDTHVRQALRDLDTPHSLVSNPLTHSSLVPRETADPDRPAALREAIIDAVAVVEDDPATERAARAVDRTFVRRAPTHEAAAEVLGMPFSTYRRHLTKGIDRVIEVLWGWEIHGDRQVTRARVE